MIQQNNVEYARDAVSILRQNGSKEHADAIAALLAEPERVRPPSEPTPEWLKVARRQGRAEALAALMSVSADEFDGDCEYIGSHAIGDTGDYGCHWEVEKLRDLFGVREEDCGEIERLEALYWNQVAEITRLREAQQWRPMDSAPVGRPVFVEDVGGDHYVAEQDARYRWIDLSNMRELVQITRWMEPPK